MDRHRTSVEAEEAAGAAVLAWSCGALVMFLIAAVLSGWSWAQTPVRSLLRLLATLAAIPAAASAISRVPHMAARGCLRILGVIALSNVLFAEMEYIQQVVVHRWYDDALLAIEARFFGGSLVAQSQALAQAPVIEGLMFGYVGYTVLLPLVGLLCHRGGGPEGMRQYSLHLALTFSACYIGFLVFPVAGPVFYAPSAYPNPLTAGVFTEMGEWIRANQHYPGGSLPSPHCAATTVMILMLRRHHRKALLVLLPTLLSIYVATVVGRYHYVWDGLAGIVAAIAMLAAADRIRAVVRAQQFRTATVRRADRSSTEPLPSIVSEGP